MAIKSTESSILYQIPYAVRMITEFFISAESLYNYWPTISPILGGIVCFIAAMTCDSVRILPTTRAKTTKDKHKKGMILTFKNSHSE